MRVLAMATPSLGDTTYIVIHDGSAVLVDPQRDVGRFLEAAASATVTHVLETHVHNDYLSGGREAARRAGADLVMPAAAGVTFPHVAAFHGEELEVEGGLTIRPLHTPGHTPEHTSYLMAVDGRPEALFSGGSLLVGSAGRTDLLGVDLAEQLARLQFQSLRRLSDLPDHVGVFPTHGAGSFCATSPAGASSSTVGSERQLNPALSATAPEEFVEAQLASLLPYPRYYAHMAPINRVGAPGIPSLDVETLSPDHVEAARSATIVDARPRDRFVAGHVPDSLNVPLGPSFASWVGWLTEFATPLVLIVENPDRASIAALELARIGYDDLVGRLAMDDWTGSGRAVSTTEVVSQEEALAALDHGSVLLDVRDPEEWKAGHVEGSTHIYVPDLLGNIPDELASADLVVACRTGHRAVIAASLLERKGLRPRAVIDGGIVSMMRVSVV